MGPSKTETVDISHKTIPLKFGIMINKRIIYLRGKLTDHCNRQEPSVWSGT